MNTKNKAVNTQIEAYLKDPDKLKFNLKELIEIIKTKIDTNSSGEGLDIGCASGVLIRNLSKVFTKYNFTGFDISNELIEHANKLNNSASSKFIVGDFNSIDFNKKFNLISGAGVLSIFEEFETPLKKWLSWLSDEGLLFLFGRFNSRNVDTKIQFKNNTRNDPKWEGGLSAFSIHTITNFLKELGFKCEFKRFHLPIEIKEDVSNPIRTFTKELKTGEKIVMDGANIIAEHYFVVIGRDLES